MLAAHAKRAIRAAQSATVKPLDGKTGPIRARISAPQGKIRVNLTLVTRMLGLTAAASLAVTMPSASAQQAAEAPNPLGLPNQPTLLAAPDPNVRTATAIVNGHVITGTDVEQRVALLVESNSVEIPEEELKRVRAQVLRNLIDETLQIQAARAEDIIVDPAEIAQTYARVAAQNGKSVEEMPAYLRSIGSSEESLKRQIQAQITWNRLLSRKVAFFVNVSAEEVNELKQRLEASKGTNEFWVWEIFLSSTPENDAAVQANAGKIVEQLGQGGSFMAYATQFSQASTAAVGGDLGWIRLPQLGDPALEAIVGQMDAGQLVGPVKIPGGYWIVYLREKRQVLMADPADAMLSLKQVQLDFDPSAPPAQIEARLAGFLDGLKTMRGCGSADEVAASLGASVVNNDQIRARALPEQLRNIILNLPVGGMTPPIGSVEEGVRVLMLCGRDDPEIAEGPDFDELMAQIEEERINKAAQRYLRDLRNDAYIEYK